LNLNPLGLGQRSVERGREGENRNVSGPTEKCGKKGAGEWVFSEKNVEAGAKSFAKVRRNRTKAGTRASSRVKTENEDYQSHKGEFGTDQTINQ